MTRYCSQPRRFVTHLFLQMGKNKSDGGVAQSASLMMQLQLNSSQRETAFPLTCNYHQKSSAVRVTFQRVCAAVGKSLLVNITADCPAFISSARF